MNVENLNFKDVQKYIQHINSTVNVLEVRKIVSLARGLSLFHLYSIPVFEIMGQTGRTVNLTHERCDGGMFSSGRLNY